MLHLGPIWYHSEPSDVPYSQNLPRPISWFELSLQQNDSTNSATILLKVARFYPILKWLMIFCESQGFLPKTDSAAMRTRMKTIPAASAPSHALTSERPNMRLPDLWSSLSSSEALEAELPDRFWAQRPRPPADDDWCGIAGLVIRDSSICSVEAARTKKRAKSNILLPTLPCRAVGTGGTRDRGGDCSPPRF